MGRQSIFKVPPFLNAMTAESLKSAPTNTDFYSFNENIYYQIGKSFLKGSEVSSILSLSNVRKVMVDKSKEIGTHVEFAVVGRSNCGKSSLINSLLGQKVAITSKTPGKTQQLITHTLKLDLPFKVSLVDAPGYGYADAPAAEMNKWKSFVERYFENSPNLLNTLLLIDSRRGIMDSDRILLEMFDDLKRMSTIVLTKADNLNASKLRDTMLKVAHDAAKFTRTFGVIFATSSKEHYGIEELQAYLSYSLLNNTGAHIKD